MAMIFQEENNLQQGKAIIVKKYVKKMNKVKILSFLEEKKIVMHIPLR